jgi:RNA polymerase sigma-70 factor (ECF subfamily)
MSTIPQMEGERPMLNYHSAQPSRGIQPPHTPQPSTRNHKPGTRAAIIEAEVKKAQQGDAEAFEHLYRMHSRHIYALCLRMVRNPAEAEDLAQESFMQLFRKIGTFRGESAFSTWLHRMAVNVVLMRLRKKTLAETSLEEATEPDEETGGPHNDFGGPDLLLAGSVDRVNLERAVKQLPPGYRSIFLLHDVQGYEHNEIASIMHCSVGNSKSQLHKARVKLRELLQPAHVSENHEHRTLQFSAAA